MLTRSDVIVTYVTSTANLSRHKRQMEFKAALRTLLSVYDQIW